MYESRDRLTSAATRLASGHVSHGRTISGPSQRQSAQDHVNEINRTAGQLAACSGGLAVQSGQTVTCGGGISVGSIPPHAVPRVGSESRYPGENSSPQPRINCDYRCLYFSLFLMLPVDFSFFFLNNILETK